MHVHRVSHRPTLALAGALVVAVAGCFPPPPGGQPPSVSDIPNTIPSAATCSATMPEVSAQIQAWLDSLPNGVTARLGAKRCYRTELPIMIRAKTDYTLDGNGSKLQAFT